MVKSGSGLPKLKKEGQLNGSRPKTKGKASSKPNSNKKGGKSRLTRLPGPSGTV